LSAHELCKAAAGDVVRLRNHLARCREHARALGFDDRLLREVQAAHALELSLRVLAEQLGLAEARRRVAARRQGRAA
jgi:branched-subunit amino acid aminotransferase/4-amino-4-deoxychorismate lyase